MKKFASLVLVLSLFSIPLFADSGTDIKNNLSAMYEKNFTEPKHFFGQDIQELKKRDQAREWNQAVDNLAAFVRKAAGKDKSLLEPLEIITNANNDVINHLQIVYDILKQTYSEKAPVPVFGDEKTLFTKTSTKLKELSSPANIQKIQKLRDTRFFLPSKKGAKELLLFLHTKLIDLGKQGARQIDDKLRESEALVDAFLKKRKSQGNANSNNDPAWQRKYADREEDEAERPKLEAVRKRLAAERQAQEALEQQRQQELENQQNTARRRVSIPLSLPVVDLAKSTINIDLKTLKVDDIISQEWEIDLQEFLKTNLDNVVFVYGAETGKNDEFRKAFGFTKADLMKQTIEDSDYFYSCPNQNPGLIVSPKSVNPNKAFFLIRSAVIYYVPAEQLLALLKSKNRVFTLEASGNPKLPFTAQIDVIDVSGKERNFKGEEINVVSKDHCQKDSNKTLYTIKVVQ